MELQEQQKQDWADKGYFFVRNVLDEPEIINNSPLEDGWFFKIKIDDDLQFADLLTEEEYNDTCED